MTVICTKPLSISIPIWEEYTGPFRHNNGYYGGGYMPPGDPNYPCAPNTVLIAGQKVSIHAVCSLPRINRSNWSPLCVGCGYVDKSHFEYAAWGTYAVPRDGVCTLVWKVDFSATKTFGISRSILCMVVAGLMGRIEGWLDIRVNGSLVNSRYRLCESIFPDPSPHLVATETLTNTVQAGDLIEYMFQVFAVEGGATVQDSSAEFSFA